MILSPEGGGLIRIVLGLAATLQAMRRLHDLGRGAHWLWAILFGQIAASAILTAGAEDIVALVLVLALGVAPFVLLGVLPGQRQSNRYGPPGRGWRFVQRAG